ncbi:MAG: hypothetical protein HC860_21745 [Alkalinema sp. RU_4_3]|nr:hypothetical protein [Alkalinema sp. RU_4_3]
MNNIAILYPVFALALWTSLVQVQIPIARFRSASKREVTAEDFTYGESSSVPKPVSIPNRNYMNLLEMPVLFYVVCLLIYVTDSTSQTIVTIAWVYVALRVLHSIIHLSYNHVIHRLIAFAASNLILIALWVLAALKVFSNAPLVL